MKRDTLQGKRVFVAGAGQSGISAARLLLDNGAAVTLWDSNPQLSEEDILSRLGRERDLVEKLRQERHPGEGISSMPSKGLSEGLRLALGKDSDIAGMAEDAWVAVVSPGIPLDSVAMKELAEAGLPIWSEIELAWQLEQGTVAAITGTNGKTTTTALLGHIMADYLGQSKTLVVGNIGNPYTREVDSSAADTVTVAEISSFQLESSRTFAPRISAILNITPDHLNRHHSMEEYIRVKELIAAHQAGIASCILNYEDPVLKTFGEGLKDRAYYFSSKTILQRGIYYRDGAIYRAEDGIETLIVREEETSLVGLHNMENIMAAAAMALGLGLPVDSIRRSIASFRAVEHRIEYVTEHEGIVYYNDSKGTNPDAAIKAIEAMSRPTVLIGGGYDKGSDYTEWLEACRGRIKALVLVGATAPAIAARAGELSVGPVYMADSFEEVMEKCFELALEGDAVLLSPACASWGMFPNFEVRGARFKEMVWAHCGKDPE